MNKETCNFCNNEFDVKEIHYTDNSIMVTTCPKCGKEVPTKKEVELSDKHLERLDEIYNAIYDMCKVISQNEDLEYNMDYIGGIADYVVGRLLTFKYCDKIYYPAVDIDENGSQKIEEYDYY